MAEGSPPPIALPRWRAPLGERSDHYVDSLLRADARVSYLQPNPKSDTRRELADAVGLVLSGGIDVDPRLYGQRRRPETDWHHPFRDRYELALLEEALRRDMPVLGICRGHQLLNVIMGGKLIQHIPGDSHRAEPEPPRRSAWHEVTLAAGSRLAGILGEGRIRVNSRHHQGVAPEMVASGLRATAVSPDGLVEAMEGERQRWLVSVQWHPERPEMAEAMAPLSPPLCRPAGRASRRWASGRLTRWQASARIPPSLVGQEGQWRGALMGHEEALRNVPLFAGLESADLQRLGRILVPRQYEAGEVILKEGDEAVGFFVISSGKVRVVKDLGGDRPQTLATLTPGEFFGETALLDGYPRTASVEAVEKTECLALTRWDFMSELKGSPTMAVEIVRVLARRLRQTDASLSE